VTFVPSNHMHT